MTESSQGIENLEKLSSKKVLVERLADVLKQAIIASEYANLGSFYRISGRATTNVIPDLLDNLSSRVAPIKVESQENFHALLERLLPTQIQKKLRNVCKDFSSGSYLYRTLVGEKEKYTAHPHDFYVLKDDEEVKLLFVDPENTVGKHNPFRPPVVNLMAARISFENADSSEVAISRYRTPVVEQVQLRQGNSRIFKMDYQKSVAEELLNGQLPGLLRNGLETEVLFWTFVNEKKVIVQGRYNNTHKLKSFLNGNKGSLALEGKVNSQRFILERFVNYLGSRDNFKKVES
jgi:hypothetical protein